MTARLLWPTLALASLLACGSTTLTGRRDTATPPVSLPREPTAMGGVPIQLTKPSFALVQKPATDGKPMTYALTVTYRPDPSERYLINISPFALATTELSLGLGAAGQLNSVNASSSSQVSSTLTALGEFAAGAIGIAAKASAGLPGADKAAPEGFKDLPALLGDVSPATAPMFCRLVPDPTPTAPPKRSVKQPRATPTPAPAAAPAAAAAGPTVVPAAAVGDPPGLAAQSAAEALLARNLPASSDARARELGREPCPKPRGGEAPAACAKRLECVRESLLRSLEPELGDDAQVSALYPVSREEALLLSAAASRAAKADVQLAEVFKKRTGQFLKEADAPARKEAVRQAVADLEGAVDASSLDRLAETQCPLDVCADPKSSASATWNGAKETARLRVREARLRAGLELASRLGAEEWRARHVQRLERRIAWRLMRAGLRDGAADPEVQELRRSVAITLDAAREYDLAAWLEKRLSEPPDEKTLAAREAARKELESLQAVMAQKRLALRSAPRAEPQPPPQERELRLDPVPKADGTPATPTWARDEAARRGNPEFLLVLEKGTQP
jgi:hypothetical protein